MIIIKKTKDNKYMPIIVNDEGFMCTVRSVFDSEEEAQYAGIEYIVKDNPVNLFKPYRLPAPLEGGHWDES